MSSHALHHPWDLTVLKLASLWRVCSTQTPSPAYPLISSQMVSLWSCASTGQRRHGRADAQTCSPCGCMAKLLSGRCAPNINQLIYSVDRGYEQYKLQVTTTISTKPRLTQTCEECIASRLLCPFCKRPASRQTQIPYQWTAL